MKIEGKPVDLEHNYLDPVTYVPNHANGNAGHADCEPCVVISINDTTLFVLNCKTRTVQAVNTDNLVWG